MRSSDQAIIMMSFGLHSGSKLTAFVLYVLFLTAAGCDDPAEPKDFAARVEESYLTESDLAIQIDSASGHRQFRDAMIRKWIESEIYYREAKKAGVTESEEFGLLMRNAEKELAKAMLLEKLTRDAKGGFTDQDLLQFYTRNLHLFKLTEKAYQMQAVLFADEREAISFRDQVLQKGWNRAASELRLSTVREEATTRSVKRESDLLSPALARIADAMYPGEVSLVFPVPGDRFFVFTVHKKYYQGETLPFDAAREKVLSFKQEVRRKQLADSLFREMAKKYSVEIR
ncbi:hypothetical protein BROC_00275 [Candidatus Brocadiaceae bacterium]|nr:hypothetical protein BROC_00275 [Candidatus Brocadiaceae bacterium]